MYFDDRQSPGSPISIRGGSFTSQPSQHFYSGGGFGEPGTAGTVIVHDATANVSASLARVPNRRRVGHHPSIWPPAAWDTPPLLNHNYIAFPPVAGGALKFTPRTIDPDTEDLVLEVNGVTAPRLIAVSWPRNVARSAGAEPTPFLIYFRPTVGQNVRAGFYVGPGLGTYPFGWDYLFYGLWRYVNYTGDPLTRDPFAKGLPYQIAASNKNAVLVLPLNKVGEELGVFLNAASIELILNKIQAFMFLRAGIAQAPPLGRVALGAFSSGNMLATQFLSNPRNQSHPFYLNNLKELYMFDAPGNLVPTWVSQALRWAGAGSSANKMIRAYTRGNHPIYKTLLGVTTPAAGPFVVDSSSGLRTAAVLPDAAWRSATAFSGAPSLVRSWQEPHQLISATMLTDALRRSGF